MRFIGWKKKRDSTERQRTEDEATSKHDGPEKACMRVRTKVVTMSNIASTKFGDDGGAAWRQICGAPRALRRRLRHIRRRRLRLRVASFLQGSVRCSGEPETVAALSRASRPAAGVSVERPPSEAQHWECFEADLTAFKRKALRELSGFHIRSADEPVPAGHSFWKQQLVVDNLAIAVRQHAGKVSKEVAVASGASCRVGLAARLDVYGHWKPIALKQLTIPCGTRS